LAIGINEVMDNVVRFLKKNHPEAKDIIMTYCELIPYDDIIDNMYYRAEIKYIKDDSIDENTVAIIKANADTGKVYFFQEGYHWTNK